VSGIFLYEVQGDGVLMLDIIHRVHKLCNLWVDLQAKTRLNGILPSVNHELAGDLIWMILTHLALLFPPYHDNI